MILILKTEIISLATCIALIQKECLLSLLPMMPYLSVSPRCTFQTLADNRVYSQAGCQISFAPIPPRATLFIRLPNEILEYPCTIKDKAVNTLGFVNHPRFKKLKPPYATCQSVELAFYEKIDNYWNWLNTIRPFFSFTVLYIPLKSPSN